MDVTDNDWHRLLGLQRRAEALGARRDPTIDSYLGHLEFDPRNPALADLISTWLDEHEQEQRLAPNRLAPPPAIEELYDPQMLPDFTVGQTTETGVLFGPRLADCGSMVVTGIAGGGKTSLVQNIVARTHRCLPGATTLAFDVKGDFTNMASLPGSAIHVHKAREELRFQILSPPAGVALQAWLATVADYFCGYRGLQKSRHLFLDATLRLCRHFGVDQDPTKPWPSLFSVLDYFGQMRGPRFGKEAEYKASLVNELRGLLEDTGSVFDTSDGIDLDTHLLSPGGIAVVQLDTLPVSAQQFIISLSIERIIRTRAARNIHNAGLEVLVVLDEAQLVLSQAADRASTNGIAPLANQLLRARETGVAFLVVSHLLPDISRAVLAAAKSMYVVGGLSDALSVDVAARTLNLPYEAKTMIPRLGRGQALVREIGKGGTYTDAFLVDLDPPELVKDAIDEPTRQRLMAPKRATFPASPSRPLADYPSLVAELNLPKPAPTNPSPTSSTGPSLTQDQYDLLLDCAHHRDDWMKERQARLNIHNYKILEKLAQSLAAQGLLVVHEIRLGSAKYSFMEVADYGWQTLQLAKPLHYIGHGSFLHTVLINRVSRYLSAQNWSYVQTEFRIGQNLHAVDVYGRSPAGVATGFEVTLSHSNVVSNALNSLAVPGGVQELFFLCPVTKDCRAVEGLLQQDPRVAPYLPQIKTCRIDQFTS
ncbi:MAG: DUF87 domain-containing protein [Phycisphaerae bacterium]|nr:DUF87 domain-containing protein [Phycisphaerae bacterium]